MIFMNSKLIILIAIIAIIAIPTFYFTANTYHSDAQAISQLNNTTSHNITRIGNGLFIDGPGNDTALIFYPGANVEYTAYVPLLVLLADNGIDCFLVEMPLNLAILNINGADEIIDNYNYSHFYMSGHSLGGSMAASYAFNHLDKVDGVILLAAYSTEDIGRLKVLSIYGSEDNVLNMEKYDQSKHNLGNYKEIVIDGANHAQFGSYGIQDGDGIAKISPEKQRNESAEAILSFV